MVLHAMLTSDGPSESAARLELDGPLWKTIPPITGAGAGAGCCTTRPQVIISHRHVSLNSAVLTSSLCYIWFFFSCNLFRNMQLLFRWKWDNAAHLSPVWPGPTSLAPVCVWTGPGRPGGNERCQGGGQDHRWGCFSTEKCQPFKSYRK